MLSVENDYITRLHLRCSKCKNELGLVKYFNDDQILNLARSLTTCPKCGIVRIIIHRIKSRRFPYAMTKEDRDYADELLEKKSKTQLTPTELKHWNKRNPKIKRRPIPDSVKPLEAYT